MIKSKILLFTALVFTLNFHLANAQESYQSTKKLVKLEKKNKKLAYKLAACLFFQNEAPYLKEWIEYHRLIGFEHFYLYNNESTDNYLEILKPYIKEGIVELHNSKGESQNQQEHATIQYSAYKKAIVKARGKVKWLALIDADEFIVPMQNETLLDILKDYENYGGLYINWLMFGTSGLQTIPQKNLMIESLVYGLPEVETLGKSIVRPDRVSNCNDAHRLFYYPPYIHVNTNHESFDWLCPKASDRLVINHYYTRDQNHLATVKYPRRRKWQSIDFQEYMQMGENINITSHSAILKFVPELRQRMHLD